MCRTKSILILFLFLFSGRLPLTGQVRGIQPQYLSTKDGLSQGLVTSIMQDSKGFLWIGTKDGLNRFNGYNFRVFRSNSFDSLSINDNRILSTLEDRNGRIWVITGGGVSIFDPKREIFYNLPADQFEGLDFTSRPTRFVFEDLAGGVLLVTTNQTIYRLILPPDSYDLSKLRMTTFKVALSNSKDLTDVIIPLKLVQINETRYLISTSQGPKVLDYNVDQEEWVLNTDLSFLPKIVVSALQQEGFKFMFQGLNENVWICHPEGALMFNSKEGLVKYFPIAGIFSDWSGGNVYWASEGKERVVFEGTIGLVILHKATGVVELAEPYRSRLFDYGQGPVYIDEGGIIWVGTRGKGLMKFDMNSARFSVSKSPEDHVLCWRGSSIRSMVETSHGDILIGTLRNFLSYSIQSKQTVTLPFSKQLVSSLVQDKNGKVWGVDKRLFLLEPDHVQGWKIAREYPIPKSDSPNGAKLFISSTGTLWLANQHNLCSIDKVSEKFTCYELPLQTVRPPLYNEYTTASEDSLGYIWVGTSAGLMRFDTVSHIFSSYSNDPLNPNSLGHNIVRAILPDPVRPKEYLWIGTAGGGLYKMNMEQGSFRRFSELEGLPDEVIYGLLPDRDGNIWMSTNHGLAVMNVTNETIKIFDFADGLQDNEFNTAAYAQTKDGVMFFGGISGFNRFRPESVLVLNKHIPKVAITGFRVSNREVRLRKNRFGFDENPAYTEALRIPPEVKSFSLEFAAMDFAETRKNQFAYRLIDFDSEWQYSGNNHSATYTNLDPGTYTFQVKAANNDGLWNEEGVSLSIVIVPPWYRTWWAYIMYAIGIGGILVFFRSKEQREQQLKHQLAIEQVEAQKLKEVDSLKSRFFANISHEFRTPLTLILGYIEQLEARISDAALRRPMQEASRNSRRLLQLINEILDLSKIDAGRMKLVYAEQDFMDFLRNLVFSFEEVAGRRNIALAISSDVESLSFAFDRQKLEKVFINLLSNALKFTGEGGQITVVVDTVSSVPLSGNGLRRFVVQIKDNGLGIESASLDHVFDRFYQSDTPRNRKGGTGIGLSLVKELVQLHRGEISVESISGEGTVFTLILPLFHVDQATDMAAPVSNITGDDADQDMAESEMEDNSHGMNVSTDGIIQILVVEDNPEIRKLISGQLQLSGYNVTEAVDGASGFQLAITDVPDLIISDITMPVMDGFAFCRAIREHESTSHIPVIMLTARVEEEDRLTGLQIGVDDYLTKPFSSKELVARIDNLLRQRKLLRERFRTMTTILPAEVSAIPADQAFMEKIVEAIEGHMGDEQFGVEALGEAVNLSPNQLHRKLTALIQQSPGQLIRTMRLQRAADLLIRRTGTVAEIGYEVGFSVPENFTRSFRKQFGLSPTEYVASNGRSNN